MKQYKVDDSYQINDNIYCILSTHSNPNILIPVKAKITDIQWDAVNPLYKVRVTKFFDNLTFLEDTFLNMGFRNSFESSKIRRPNLSSIAYKNIDEFTIIINKDNEFVVDGTLCVKTLEQLEDLFESIEYYIISNYVRDLKNHLTRNFLNGPFKTTRQEFNENFRNAYEEKFKKYNVNIYKYLQSL